jgi:hypothetical protein
MKPSRARTSRDDATVDVEPQNVLSALKRGVDGLCLAYPTNFLFEDADPEVEAAVRDAGSVLVSLGAQITEKRSRSWTKFTNTASVLDRDFEIALKPLHSAAELVEDEHGPAGRGEIKGGAADVGGYCGAQKKARS